MSFNLKITGQADMTEANAEIDNTKLKNAQATKAMAQQLRTVATMATLTVAAFGGGVNMMYTLGIEAVAVALETIASIRVAMATTTIGVSEIFQIAVGTAAVTALIIQMVRLKQGREEAAAETGKIAALFKFGMYL